MYSRNYFKEETEAPKPPENYSGVALSEESETHEEEDAAVNANPWEHNTEEKAEESAPVFSGLFSGKGLGGLFGGKGIRDFISGIGTEEILIIAVALFLFISGDGDKECAIMLLLLLIF